MTDSYGDAMAKALAAVSAARLADPDEHFPYKLAEAKAAIRKTMSPDPGDKTHDVTGADVMSVRIAEASQAYIEAQKAMLLDPSTGNRELYQAATDDLIAARKTHRRGRVDADGKPVGGMIATSSAPPPPGQGSWRARRVGEA